MPRGQRVDDAFGVLAFGVYPNEATIRTYISSWCFSLCLIKAAFEVVVSSKFSDREHVHFKLACGTLVEMKFWV